VQQLEIHFNSKAGRISSLYLYLYTLIQGFDVCRLVENINIWFGKKLNNSKNTWICYLLTNCMEVYKKPINHNLSCQPWDGHILLFVETRPMFFIPKNLTINFQVPTKNTEDFKLHPLTIHGMKPTNTLTQYWTYLCMELQHL